MRLWIKRPLAILAENAAGGIVIESGVIVELVAANVTPLHDQVFDASQHVVIPGLVNTHHHFYQTLTRAHPNAINKELFDWLRALYPLWARLTPEAHRIATRLALTELLMSVVTTTSDHHYVFPGGLDDAMDIQVEEARRVGVRMTVTRGSMNLSEKDGGLPPDSVVQDHDTILSDCERVIQKYHQRGAGATIQITRNGEWRTWRQRNLNCSARPRLVIFLDHAFAIIQNRIMILHHGIRRQATIFFRKIHRPARHCHPNS